MRFTSRLAVTAAALAFFAAPVVASTLLDDAVITASVKAALLAHPAAKAHQIDVETRDGIVQLNGYVDSAAGKTAAARVANVVSGVKGVDNNLTVDAGKRAPSVAVEDAAVTARVKTALGKEPTTKATGINVDARDGTVLLNGYVDSESARTRATEVAGAVDGVRHVENRLTVEL
jgi:hyperosmotically inducible protein